VYGQTDPLSHGTFAEYTAIEAHRIAKKPDRLSAVEAASLPNVLLAAWNGLFSVDHGADLQRGHTVLIHGAAGGIGSAAVQLAVWRGARVIGTASRGNLEFLQKLGAAQMFDYALEGWQHLGAIDAVLNTADGAAASALCATLRSGGRYVAFRGLPDARFVADQLSRGIRCSSASGPASVKDFAHMAQLVAAGAVNPIVSGVYPIEDFREALERVRDGHVRGKIVLKVSPDD
jgi:NADPH:quinone reductase-like Zn-dependent oxidoreductase